jgi:hypothetical protein
MAEIIQVSIDESGYRSSLPGDIFLFAGYAGSVACWEEFTHAWHEIVDGDPELENTNTMKKLFRWKGPRSDPRTIRLIDAVNASGLKSARWKIRYDEYLSVIPNTEHLYLVGWLGMLSHTIVEFRLIADAQLQIYYDQNINEEDKIQSGYRRFYEWAAATHPDWCGMLPFRAIPENDVTFWPLRVADALAQNDHRAYWHERKKRKPFPNPLWKMLNSGEFCFNETWTKEDLLNTGIVSYINRLTRTNEG